MSVITNIFSSYSVDIARAFELYNSTNLMIIINEPLYLPSSLISSQSWGRPFLELSHIQDQTITALAQQGTTIVNVNGINQDILSKLLLDICLALHHLRILIFGTTNPRLIINPIVFSWPSLSLTRTHNKTNNKKYYKNCWVFAALDDIENIYKDIEFPCANTSDTLYIFTDGATKNAGTDHASISWAYLVTDCVGLFKIDSGVVCSHINGTKNKLTNNYAELLALLHCMEYIYDKQAAYKLVIITDSKYVIDTISQNTRVVANMLIIDEIISMLDSIDLEFIHVNSHCKEPEDVDTMEWFKWRGNDIVDKLCQIRLGRQVIDIKN